jgi:cytochrome P450
LGPGAERQIIFAGDEQHARLRRIFGPAFTPKAVEEQGGMLLKYADQLVATLKENIKRNPVQDMSKLYNATTFDLTGEFAFDESFHCLEKGGASHFFMEIVLKGTIAGLFICQLERYGIWQVLQRLLPKSFFKEKYQLDDYAAALVDRRRERGFVPGKTDVFNYLLQSKHEQDRLSREELIDNTTVLVVAGSETTATLLSGASWLLCKNKDIYAKVKQEVRSAYSTDDDITPKSVNNLPYMIAVLSEAMRLFPPTGFGFPRIIGANEGQSIAGYHVPSDVSIVAT